MSRIVSRRSEDTRQAGGLIVACSRLAPIADRHCTGDADARPPSPPPSDFADDSMFDGDQSGLTRVHSGDAPDHAPGHPAFVAFNGHQ
jgi:hypothetical protein